MRIKGSYSTVEERLRNDLVDIVRECQSKIFRLYRQTNGSSQSSTGSVDGSSAIQSPPTITENYAFEGPALFDLSTTTTAHSLHVTLVDPLANHPRSLYSHPIVNNSSDPQYMLSPEYLAPGQPYVGRNQSRDNDCNISSISSFDNVGTFSDGQETTTGFFDSWQNEIHNFEGVATMADAPSAGDYFRDIS
jgi:hypothetical protein